MVFPISDDNSDRATTPFVNYVLIALNILVFVLFQGMGSNEKFTYAWSTVPVEITTGRDVDKPVVVRDPLSGEVAGQIDLQPTPGSVYLTLLTSMFMHGGWAHLLGNMLYLWIFGDNIEDKLGHFRYLAFYLVCGFAADMAHVLLNASSYIPSLGASGAISGVLGGYVLLFPHRKVNAIVLRMVTTIPAWAAIGIWFAFQLINGLGFLGEGSQEGGGVAYAAHVGGFVAGLLLVKLFAVGRGGAAAGGPMISSQF
ncbi:MAG TPA: rhomboid family intramembrane serine protease [Pyrinomonadaceae bacterium]|jgi:membrane associated rhomboid family serine protease|nr:rhomboid family intramembrane serine protease [Pyrinomonadaceae bacterium]